ncbi:MAG: hypothetical protein WCK09_07070 [Bacteroidota bacterium]
MKSRWCLQVVLFFLAIAISGFDRHLSNYFQGEVKAMVQSDALPAHHDLPVKTCDHHEDITLKTCICAVPVPVEISNFDYLIFCHSIPRISPHTVWQPPENIL